MRTEDVDKVAEFLDTMGIKYTKVIDCILVDRDSIVANIAKIIPDVTENEAYDYLRVDIMNCLGNEKKRFYYASKTDNWLMIDVAGAKKEYSGF